MYAMQGVRKGTKGPPTRTKTSEATSINGIKQGKSSLIGNKQVKEELSNATSDAAELVLKEREKERKERSKRDNDVKEVELEKVSELEGLKGGKLVDESELDRRQRALHQQLEKKENEAKKTAEALEKLRKDLKALEEPIKAEIFQIRTQLEEANRHESTLVVAVNDLRKQLHAQETTLKQSREKKQALADSLISLMADYEKRKTERLNEIASILGDGSGKEPGKGQTKNNKPSFEGF